MPSVDVVDLQRQKVGTRELREDVFGVPADQSVVHEAVVMQLASARQGTASTRTRGEVSGSGKKLWKQKHTGRARVGSIRSPLWRHGGTVFGPQPRDYGYRIPKKKYRVALRGALSSKLAAGMLVVVSDLPLESPKTRLLAGVLQRLGLTGKTLIVLGEERADIVRAARNLRNVKVVRPQDLNVYDVLRYDAIVVSDQDVTRLQEVWA